MVIFGCTHVICKPYCPDVIEHYVRHRCYLAYFGCTDVICNLIAQMLLSSVSGTDVLMPVSYNMFKALMLMCLICGQDVIRPIFNYFIFSSGMLNNRVNNPTLNRNIGKYNLPHIADNLLFSIPELKMK